MEAMKSGDGSFTPALLLAIGLLVVSALVVTRLVEPTSLKAEQGKAPLFGGASGEG
jgi:hypothetical protein